MLVYRYSSSISSSSSSSSSSSNNNIGIVVVNVSNSNEVNSPVVFQNTVNVSETMKPIKASKTTE